MAPHSRIRAIASFGDDPRKVEVVLPPGDVPEMLSKVTTKPQFTLFGTSLSYRYPADVLANLPDQPENTLVEVALPYCLDLPNSLQLRVTLPGLTQAHMVLRKTWTHIAGGSSDADYFARDCVTYHVGGALQTPQFPHDPVAGPAPQCTGRNIEWDRDRSGAFRYTRARIYLHTTYPQTIATDHTEFRHASNTTTDLSLRVVNRLIDVYRLVTGSDHVQRLPAVHVTDLFFRDHNIGAHGASFGYGIRSAVMNRSEIEIGRVASLMASGDDLPTYDLLWLDAEASLRNNQFTLAVVHAFQALELRLEELLRTRLEQSGVEAQAIETMLDETWQTKRRLRDLLPLATQRSLRDETQLWDAFCTEYDQVRNKLIHAARTLDHSRTERTLRVCREVISWLNTL